MNELLKKYLKGDSVIWIIFMLLCVISAVEMYSASSSLAYRQGSYTAPILRHIAFLGAGAALVFFVHQIHYKYFRKLNYLLLLASFAFLIATQFWGESAGEAKRWFSMGFFQFQPSELAKISLIIFIADILARRQKEGENADGAFVPIVVVTLMFCALIFTENLSTALLIFIIALLMMIIGRISFKNIFKLMVPILAVGAVAFFIGWKVPKDSLPGFLDRLPTQSNRIVSHFSEENPPEKITDENRQIVNSQIAISYGRFFPKLPGSSIQRDYLPEAYSDFIYAIIIEEMGILGGVFVIALFLILLYRAGITTIKSTQIFPALLVIGLTLMLVLQAFISMAVTVRLGPVTGQPLPLISRGGTSILVTCLYFGMILSVTRYLKEENAKEAEGVEIAES